MDTLITTIREQCIKYRLTNREKEVISHAFSGKTDKEIAHVLGNSPRTVHHQLQSVYRKLGVRTRMEGVHKLLQAAGQNM
jgi:DNA-binding NarL/FixJ family response regulator